MVPMMSRCRGCRDTVKRVKRAWRGNTVAMMHYRRIVKSRGRQKDREKDYAHLLLPHLEWRTPQRPYYQRLGYH